MYEALVLGVTLGLASALHCVAMCGSLNAFVAIGPGGQTNPWRVARYQVGRVIGYSSLGAVLGALGGSLADLIPPASEAILSVTLGLALVVAAVQLWPRSAGAPALVTLGSERRPPTPLQRASRSIGSALVHVRRVPMLLGLLSTFLPCGVLAAGALLAASTGHAATGAIAMTGLAMTSGLAVSIVGAGLGRVRITQSRTLARAMATMLVLGAVLLFVRPVLMEPSSEASCHPHP